MTLTFLPWTRGVCGPSPCIWGNLCDCLKHREHQRRGSSVTSRSWASKCPTRLPSSHGRAASRTQPLCSEKARRPVERNQSTQLPGELPTMACSDEPALGVRHPGSGASRLCYNHFFTLLICCCTSIPAAHKVYLWSAPVCFIIKMGLFAF